MKKIVKQTEKTSSGSFNKPEKRTVPRSGKSQSYDAKAITGKRKSYCGG